MSEFVNTRSFFPLFFLIFSLFFFLFFNMTKAAAPTLESSELPLSYASLPGYSRHIGFSVHATATRSFAFFPSFSRPSTLFFSALSRHPLLFLRRRKFFSPRDIAFTHAALHDTLTESIHLLPGPFRGLCVCRANHRCAALDPPSSSIRVLVRWYKETAVGTTDDVGWDVEINILLVQLIDW